MGLESQGFNPSEKWEPQNPPDFMATDPNIWLDGERPVSLNILPTLDTAIDEITEDEPKTPEQLSQAIEVLLEHKWLQSSPEYIQKIETRKTLEQTGEKFFNILKIKDKNGTIREFFKYSRGQNPEIPPRDLITTGIEMNSYAYTIKPPSEEEIEIHGELASSTLEKILKPFKSKDTDIDEAFDKIITPNTPNTVNNAFTSAPTVQIDASSIDPFDRNNPINFVDPFGPTREIPLLPENEQEEAA
jgi:hypothetical protein